MAYTSFSNLSEMIVGFAADTSKVESVRLKALKNSETLGVEYVAKELNKFLMVDLS